jgi:hypothetical protein
VRSGIALLLVCLACGCLYHEASLRVRSPTRVDGAGSGRLSDEAVAMVVQSVAEVAREEGLSPKRGFSKPFIAKLLVRYTSPEQISVAVWLSRNGRELDIRFRDVNHTRETSYTRSLRSQIETRIQAELPEYELHYGTRRNP